MGNYNVYLSSTFRDLEEYRKAILELFRYISDDFSITAMEGYTAADMTATEKCIADVEKCDVYILLLAARYGYIPPNNNKNQNADALSITELEYSAAINNKKKIFVFMPDINNAEGIKFMEDEDGPDKEEKQQKLKAFRQAVSEQRMSSKPFVKPQELIQLVSAALIKLIKSEGGVKETRFNETLKYCCDRSEQFNVYQQNRTSGISLFHVFVTTGHQYDTGGNLTNRCAIFSLHLPEQEIIPMAFEEFFYSDSVTKNIEQFIYVLHSKLLPEAYITQSSLQELETAIMQKAGDVVIRMNCYEDFLDADRINFLVAVFGNLHSLCLKRFDAFKKRLYFFLNVEDSYEDVSAIQKTADKIKLLEQQAKPLELNLIVFSRFKMVSRMDINNWMDNFITDDNEIRDELYDEHFARDLNGSFRLRVAEKSIRRLFNRIRENDTTIINILNKTT